MNKLYTYISLLSCIVLMPGCMNFEEFEEPIQKTVRTFYAEMEAQPVTKTVLGEKDAEGIRPVLWMLEDKIGVAPSSGSQSTFDVFVNKTTELADTAIFEGATVSTSSYYAIYPYDESTKIQADSIIFTLNQFQSYKEASFDQGAFPMVARSSDTGANGFQFQNLCGVLEINLTGVEKIKSLTFKAKRPVCGQLGVGMKYETYPEMTASVLASNSVTLNCGKGVQLNESTPTPFYLVLPPAEYETFELIITTKDGKMMRKQSQKPLNIKRSYIIEAGALAFVELEVIDLSEFETANCYIVSSAGNYKFNASVIGNGSDGILPSSVEVLWETKGIRPAGQEEIIRNVQLLGDYVTFEATGMEGNALIAVKDAAGVILWSWHIWVTDTPKDQFYYNGTGTFFVQDRNLGAIRADKGTGDGELKESFGMYYQWGRKDPFVAGLYTIGDKKIALATSIAEPTVFPATDSHWLISDDYELWNSSEKTIYDPCPPGYIIGSSDLWNSLRYQQIENVDNGWELMIDDVYRTWIPASSWIDVYGSPMNYNDEVYFWSGTYNKSLHIHNQSVQVSSWRLNNGFAVRCMSEKGPSANLQTDSVTEVTKTSAVLNGSIEYLQDGIISEMGFLWSTSKDFIDANTLKVDVCEGKFSATLNNLKLGTTYYVRTYAIDNGRTVYGTSQNFMLQNADIGEDIPEGDEYEW